MTAAFLVSFFAFSDVFRCLAILLIQGVHRRQNRQLKRPFAGPFANRLRGLLFCSITTKSGLLLPALPLSSMAFVLFFRPPLLLDNPDKRNYNRL